jgi:ABC-type multidrug transport system permease subunit
MDVFEAFDNLVLLKVGGRIMYFGPLGEDSSHVVSYFGSYDGVVPLTPGYNPATWMLEVTGSSMSTVFKAADKDFAELYQESSLCTVNTATANQLVSEAASASAPVVGKSKYAAPLVQRYKMILWKFFIIYWRSPHYNFTRMVLTLFVAFLYGLVYYNQGKIDPNGATIGDVQNVLGLLFSMAVFVGMFNANNVLPLLFSERPVYYRERAAGMYGPLSYSTATGVAELPYLLVQALIMVCIAYWLVGFAAVAWKFFYFLLMFFTSLCVYTYMGNFMSTISPSLLMSALIVSLFSQTWTIVNGYLIPYDQIPIYWKWLNRVAPATWIIYGLGTSQLGDVDAPMQDIDGEMTTVSEFLESFFGYEYSFIWWAWLITLAFAVVFRLGSGAALKLFNFNKR